MRYGLIEGGQVDKMDVFLVTKDLTVRFFSFIHFVVMTKKHITQRKNILNTSMAH